MTRKYSFISGFFMVCALPTVSKVIVLTVLQNMQIQSSLADSLFWTVLTLHNMLLDDNGQKNPDLLFYTT